MLLKMIDCVEESFDSSSLPSRGEKKTSRIKFASRKHFLFDSTRPFINKIMREYYCHFTLYIQESFQIKIYI